MFNRTKELEQRLEQRLSELEEAIGESHVSEVRVYLSRSLRDRLDDVEAENRKLSERHEALQKHLEEGLLLAGVEYHEEEEKPPKKGWRVIKKHPYARYIPSEERYETREEILERMKDSYGEK